MAARTYSERAKDLDFMMAEALSVIGLALQLAGPLKDLITTISALIHVDQVVEKLIAAVEPRITALTNLLVQIEQLASDADHSDKSQYNAWKTITQAERRLGRCLQQLKTIVSDMLERTKLAKWRTLTITIRDQPATRLYTRGNGRDHDLPAMSYS